MRVTIIGPNLPRPECDQGTLHVHAEGCRDIKARRGYRLVAPHWTIDAASVLDVVGAIYDPSNFEYDLDDPESRSPYETDVHFAPCTRALPYDEAP